MTILFQDIVFLKEFLACNDCVWLFIKIKKESGTSFVCTFSASFFHKNVTYSRLYQLIKFQCHTFFPSQDIKQNMLLSSYLDNSWHRKFNIFFDHPLKQWPTERKKGDDENTQIWIFRERKELLRMIKMIVVGYMRCSPIIMVSCYLQKWENSSHYFGMQA